MAETSCENPRISVFIPTFLRGVELARALESVAAQTIPVHEILVLNNNPEPTEEIREAVKSFEERHGEGQIVYLEDTALGVWGTRNACFSKASGEYIAMLDDDDYWEPEYLAAVIEKIRENGKPGDPLVIVSAYQAVDELGNRLSVKVPPLNYRFSDVAIRNPGYVVSNMVVAREALIKAGGFDEKLRNSSDRGLVVALMMGGASYACIEEPLVYKEFSNAGRQMTSTYFWRIRGKLAFYRKYLGQYTFELSARYFGRILWNAVVAVGSGLVRGTQRVFKGNE